MEILLTEQTILPTVELVSIEAPESGFANYQGNSASSSTNALIDILDNTIVLIPPEMIIPLRINQQ